MVREFAREDERRVMLVLDPFIGPPRADLGAAGARRSTPSASSAPFRMAACIAWHFNEINSVMQFRTRPLFDAHGPGRRNYLRHAARAGHSFSRIPPTPGGEFLERPRRRDAKFSKSSSPARPQRTIPTALWSSSYFLFLDSL